jgi:uncharacterized protein YfaS (alpha-2-macroglobulin family)
MGRGLGAVAAFVVMGAIAAGAWGIKDLPRFNRGQPVQARQDTPRPAELAAVRSVAITDNEAVPSGELRYRRLAVEAGGETAEACLVFSAPLDATGAVRYSDYVGLPAGIKAGFRVDGARLCLSGFAFGADYRAELRPGLPGAKGEKLAAAGSVMLGFGDRPSSVAFGPGFILPREVAEGLPVTTVNIAKLDVTVYRVGDRLLARMRQDLVDQRKVYPYEAREIGDDEGRLVWNGSMAVAGPRNEAVVSLFPLAEGIGKAEPGAYLVVAKNSDAARKADESDYYYSDDYRPVAGQWVVQSDLGLTSFTGADGLTLVARSLKTAKPVEGVRLTLTARNNDELATIATDRDGKARFPAGLLRGAGGMAPVMVMAYAGNDFNFLDLRRPNFDLSDRGVDGRPPAGAVDAFLYTERGIYRPGETVELVALARDARAQAISGATLVVKINKPDGKEYRRYTVKDAGGGAGHTAVPLPASANRGNWEAVAFVDPEGEAVGRVAFEVQDFVPQRLGLSIGERPAALKPGEALSIPVEARFLYGAPASALGGEAELTLEPDPAPYPRHKGFRWGMADEKFAGARVELTMAATDDTGRTLVTGSLPDKVASTLPLRADIGIAVREPGGRATAEHVHVPVRTHPVALGIRPHFDGNVRDGQDARFDVIALDQAGEPVAVSGVEYRILKDSSTWQWFRSGTSWRYERVARETEVATGTLAIGSGAPAQLARVVTWGSYRLVVRHPASGAATSMTFWGGWYGNATAERPDRLKLAADKAGYQPGDTARLHIDSDAAGEALLVIANEQVHETRAIQVPAGGVDVTIPVKQEWGAGAYAMVTLYRPLTDKLGHAPVRAVGIAWLGLDPARRTLGIAIGAPGKVDPRTRLEVPIKVTGGERAFVTLAAIDQGILQLTRFKSPAPQAHYLSKRRLGVGMRDDYGRLIRGMAGHGDDQGGDAFGGKGLDVVPTRTVALFSGIVALKSDGTATIPLEIPDFQGELRLMAVAFDGDKVGSAEARMIVRDPVVAELILPRFLAPGDSGRATMLLHNVDGTAGEYRVSIRPHDTVGGGMAERPVTLAKGVREVFTVPLDAREAGIGSVELAVKGPDGFAVSRAWPIQVRPPQLPETRQSVEAMPPGGELELGKDLLAPFVPGTGAVAVSVSRWQGLDVPGLLRWLDRYPFGCLEQTTSRALPLLYFNDMALLVGKAQDQGIEGRVQDAVERVVAMQTAEGAFRMWGQWGDDADPWISVFALDFLTRAADKGFDIPASALSRGRQWMITEASRADRDDVRAYAAAVLARKGSSNAGDLRYFHDSRPPKGALAFAHLGAALDAVGERARAGSAFDQARKALAAPAPAVAVRDVYGSRLRDTFGVAALMAGSGRAAQVPVLLSDAHVFDTRAENTTTQEKAWMLLAAAEMARNSGRLAVEMDGKPLGAGDPAAIAVTPEALARGVRMKNNGDGEVFRIVSAEGVPAEPLPPSGTGLTLSKQVFTLDGQPVDLATMRRNDRMVVVVEGEAVDKVQGDYAILDLLPSGWEIEGILRPEQPGYAWIGTLSEAQMRQARDDRYVAAVPLPNYEMDRSDPDAPSRREGSKTWRFRVAYAVRAVTPGAFALPAAVAEHMYVPKVRARTGMGRVVIGE